MSNRCKKCGSLGAGSIHTGKGRPWKACRRCGRAWAPMLRWWVDRAPDGLGWWQIYQVGSLASPRVGAPVRFRWTALRNLQRYLESVRIAQAEEVERIIEEKTIRDPGRAE